MLIVSPVQTENEKTELCRLCGVEKVEGALCTLPTLTKSPLEFRNLK